MRVLSVAPALLIASFAAAAPSADNTGTAVSARGDNSIQNVIDIVSGATNKLEPLSEQLSTALQSSDASQVDSVVSQINTIVSNTAQQLQSATEGVDLTPSNLSALSPVVFSLVTLLNSILLKLIPAVKGILANAASNTLTLVSNLLTSVNILTTFLKPFAVGTLAGILGPVLNLVNYVLNTVASLLGLHY